MTNTIQTSRNQSPAVIKQNPDLFRAMHVLNFGAGKFPQTADKVLKDLGAASVFHYEPNACLVPLVDVKQCSCEYEYLANVPATLLICANVLNVLEDSILIEVIEQLNELNKRMPLVISVYEGNKSGVGNPTRDGYQRNERLEDYRQYFNETVKIKGGFLCPLFTG